MSAKLQKRFAEDKGIPPRIDMYNLTINIEEGIPPRIDMYNLTINIEVDNYDYLMELQEALNNGLAGIPSEKGMVRYSFDLSTIDDQDKFRKIFDYRYKSRGGVAAPPPLEEEEAINYDEIGDVSLGHLKEELKKYILNWYEYLEKRNGDFIEEEEMKL